MKSCHKCKREATVFLSYLDKGLCNRCLIQQSERRIKRALRSTAQPFTRGAIVSLYDDGTPEAAVSGWTLSHVLKGYDLKIRRSKINASWETRKESLDQEHSERSLVVIPWTVEDELRLFTEGKGSVTNLGAIIGSTIKLPRCLTQEECVALANALTLDNTTVLSHGDFFTEFQDRDPSYCFGWLSSIDHIMSAKKPLRQS